MFHTFAQTDPTTEGVVGFANAYGLLGLPDDDRRLSEGRGEVFVEDDESLDRWFAEIGAIRDAVTLWNGLRGRRVKAGDDDRLMGAVNDRLAGAAAPRLTRDRRSGRPVLQDFPLSLLGAVWLQFARAVGGNKEYRACASCERWFEVSPETARTNRQFCSEACRSRAYRDRKGRAVELRAEGWSFDRIAGELGSDLDTVKGWCGDG
jgi:hypothetical protein